MPGPALAARQSRISGFTAGCLLVSNVIGGGIFTTSGFMARDLGDPWLILALWAVGAFLALAGALSYGELAAAFPQVGGDYIYLREAYGPLLGFLSGWASFTVGFGAALAASSVSFAAYVLRLVPHRAEVVDETVAVQALALLLIWSVTVIHATGVQAGGLLQRTLTVGKAGSIFILVSGALLFGSGSWEHFPETLPVRPSLGEVAVSFIFVLYAYSGWNAVGYIAGEVLEPSRTIPTVLTAGMLFVGAVYVLLNVVYIYAMPVGALAQPPILPVAEKAAVALFGPAAAQAVTILLALSIAAAVSAMVWAGPRIYQAMAGDGQLPTLFAQRWGIGGAPAPAILIQTVWASVLILSGTFEQLVVYAGVILGIFSALTVSTVVALRHRRPSLVRPYRVPLYPLLPVAYVLMALAVVLYTALERPTEAALGLLTVLTGLPLYFLGRPQPRQKLTR
jgi:APA family basic amino acid/polyamine antiporter